MIKIHRTKPLIHVGANPVQLSRSEHELITILAMCDNRLVRHDVLLDLTREHPVQIPADRDVLHGKMARLKKKLGGSYLAGRRQLGYQLTGQVEFFG